MQTATAAAAAGEGRLHHVQGNSKSCNLLNSRCSTVAATSATVSARPLEASTLAARDKWCPIGNRQQVQKMITASSREER